jgi:hypothetical protein
VLEDVVLDGPLVPWWVCRKKAVLEDVVLEDVLDGPLVPWWVCQKKAVLEERKWHLLAVEAVLVGGVRWSTCLAKQGEGAPWVGRSMCDVQNFEDHAHPFGPRHGYGLATAALQRP